MQRREFIRLGAVGGLSLFGWRVIAGEGAITPELTRRNFHSSADRSDHLAGSGCREVIQFVADLASSLAA